MKNTLFQEFNMSRWLDLLGDSIDDISWKDVMFERLCWHESNQDLRLADWENKLGMKAIFRHYGVETANIYMQTSQAHTPTLKKEVEKLVQQDKAFIIKPSHLCGSTSIYAFQDSKFKTVEAFEPVSSSPELNSPELEASEIEQKSALEPKEETIELSTVIDNIMQANKERCAPREAWALRNCRPGILIEELLDFDLDLRVMTLWGKFHGIRIMGEEKIWIDKDGRLLNDTESAEEIMQWLEPHLISIKTTSERLAQSTDMLRVDFFVSKNGAIRVNEICSFVWPEATTFLPFYKDFTRSFLNGYDQFSGQLVERKFARLHVS